MAYSKKEIDEKFNLICSEIESGKALRNVLKAKGMPSSQTFYIWIDSDVEKSKQYARACEYRADNMFEDLLDIADDSSEDRITTEDGRELFNTEFAARSKIRIDARKWILGKLNPKKYGDKSDLNLTVTKGANGILVEDE